MMQENQNRNLLIRFNLNDVRYRKFIQRYSRLRIREYASDIKGQIKYYYRENEARGMHLIEMGLYDKKAQQSGFDLVGAVKRADNNKQVIDLVGQYVNMSNKQYESLANHESITKTPCAVCGGKNKRRRTMYLMHDDRNNEYEYVGNECVQKLMPSWSNDSYKKLFKNITKLQAEFADSRVEDIPKMNTIDVLKSEYPHAKDDHMNKSFDFAKLRDKLLTHEMINLNSNAMRFFSAATKTTYLTTNGIDQRLHDEILPILALRERRIGRDGNIEMKEVDWLTEDEQSEVDRLMGKFNQNLQTVESQYQSARDKINSTVKLIHNPDQFISFEESVEKIKSHHSDESTTELFKAIQQGQMRMNQLDSIKKTYYEYLIKENSNEVNQKQFFDNMISQFNDLFKTTDGNDIFKELLHLDQIFLETSSRINSKLNQIIDVE